MEGIGGMNVGWKDDFECDPFAETGALEFDEGWRGERNVCWRGGRFGVHGGCSQVRGADHRSP